MEKFLLILTFSILFFSLSSSHFTPSDNYLLDCGSDSDPTILTDRRIFTPDTKLLISPQSKKVSFSNLKNVPQLYRTARVFTKPSVYEFQIKTKGTHLIRLHFYPSNTEDFNLTSAKFHVVASGFVLLHNFAFEAGISNSLRLKEYFINVDSDRLEIAFVPASDSLFAFVNAIEVVSSPEELIADDARLVTSDKVEDYVGLKKQALETVYRVNVGGAKVTPFNDTFWRSWVPDNEFLVSGLDSEVVHFGGRIMYRKYGASREVVPDNVANSARVSKKDMKWAFAVRPEYKYMVRMHFCDIASLALNELYLDVYFNGYLAYKEFDISDATGQLLASPYYVDFVINVGTSGYLSIVVGPSKISDPVKIGGLLNGLEIMKISNAVGSLDGDTSIAYVIENPRAIGSFAAFGRSLACGLAFVCLLWAVGMLLLKLKAERKASVAWSRLPVDIIDAELVKGTSMASGKLAN